MPTLNCTHHKRTCQALVRRLTTHQVARLNLHISASVRNPFLRIGDGEVLLL